VGRPIPSAQWNFFEKKFDLCKLSSVMSPERWQQINQLFYDVLARPPAARAATLRGNETQARRAYQDFLAAWKDADADLPILLEARRESVQYGRAVATGCLDWDADGVTRSLPLARIVQKRASLPGLPLRLSVSQKLIPSLHTKPGAAGSPIGA
jgi:hypothetical protein